MDIQRMVQLAEEFESANSAALRFAEEFAERNRLIVETAEAAADRFRPVFEEMERQASRVQAMVDSLGIQSQLDKVASIAEKLADSPMMRVQSAVEKFAREAQAHESALNEMMERMAPTPAPEPSYGFLTGPQFFAEPARPAYGYQREIEIEDELPERTIIRKELTRRIGFAPFDEGE